MPTDDQLVPLAGPAAPPPGQSARLWLYTVTQWRRIFGLNFSRLDDLLFVGGEFSPVQWVRLHGMGIRAVLSLQAEREDRFAGPQPTRALRLAVEDFHAPALDQLQQAVDFSGGCRADRLPVLVHCHAGVGRAALTASAYLMTQGLSHVEAFGRVRRARPIVALNRRQLERLIEWEWLLRSQIASISASAD